MIMLVLGSAASFLVPYEIGMVVDQMTKKDWNATVITCSVMIGIIFLSGVASGLRGSVFNIMSEKIARDLRYDLFYFLIRKDIGWYDENKTGEILSRISKDTAVI